MTKRILSIMLAIVLVLASATIAFAEQPDTANTKAIIRDKCGDNLWWYLTDANVLWFEGSGDMYDYSLENPAPWEQYKNAITTIRFYSGSTADKAGAKSIGDYAFYGMSNVEIIEIQEVNMIERIGAYAFFGCSSVPNIINADAFAENAEIGEYAFAECTNLRSFPLPKRMSAVPEGAFMNCAALTDIQGKTSAFFVNAKAFYNCTALNGFNFDSIHWSIGEYAFYNCSSLTTVDLSKSSVDYIGNYAFANCENIESVITSSTPSSTIGNHAFENDGHITNVQIRGKMTTIGKESFSGCTSLTSVDLSNADSVCEHAFDGCVNLTSVQFDDGLKSIKAWAFANTGLSGAIYLPITLDHIGENAFDQTDVEDLYVYSPDCEFENNAIGAVNPAEVTVHGFNNSTAQSFANAYGYNFERITTGFSDTNENAYYTAPVAYMHYKGWFSGTGHGEFSPHATMTRAMLVTVLWRMSGSPEVQSDIPFNDVACRSYYEAAVRWAYSHGIVAGTSDTSFSPNMKITREQLATILYRYAQSEGMSTIDKADLNKFSDQNKISSWAREAMSWSVAIGIINGTSETTLSPKGDAQRCQAATMLVRYIMNTYPVLIK